MSASGQYEHVHTTSHFLLVSVMVSVSDSVSKPLQCSDSVSDFTEMCDTRRVFKVTELLVLRKPFAAKICIKKHITHIPGAFHGECSTSSVLEDWKEAGRSATIPR